MSRLLLPPHRLVALFERGGITRAQLQAAMTVHQQRLLMEIAEARQSPVLSFLDEKLSRYVASRLERRHGEKIIRMVLRALADIDDFPPADLLWNAEHPDVPLHCFFRLRREPVFRLISLTVDPLGVKVVIEHGQAAKRHTTRQEIRLVRDRFGKLSAGAGSMLN
ncbi:MAG TPA: hypothetical protein DD438_01865 [Verrucomicrobiales bacterium]|nr:hypothetical protein [Verrucomicrobiales bacterium]HCQ38339.1 hypothetical protein [Verrucomicrobiales bacterium]